MFRISVNILRRTIRTIQFTPLTHLTISIAQSSSKCPLQASHLRPLPQQQTSTINTIPSRPLPDDGPSASFPYIAEEINFVELQRDKLALKLEVLNPRKASPDNTVSKDVIDGEEPTKDRPERREPSTGHMNSTSHEFTIQFTLIPPNLKVLEFIVFSSVSLISIGLFIVS